MLKFNSPRIYSRYQLDNFRFFCGNNGSYSYSNVGIVTDNMNSTSQFALSTNNTLNNITFGYTFDYLNSTYDSSLNENHSSHIFEIDSIFQYFSSGSSNILSLSPSAVPINAYVIYDGVYSFRVFDGSNKYERTVYDNPFSITKPVSFSLINTNTLDRLNGFESYGAYKHRIVTPFLGVDDLLSNQQILNHISNYNTFVSSDSLVDNSIMFEDLVTEISNLIVRNMTIVIEFDCSMGTIIPYKSNIEPSLELTSYKLYSRLLGDSNNSDLVRLNISSRSGDISENPFTSLSNGFYYLSRGLTGTLSNVVTNATDNANRIIENTTNKINEVKQGVTEVKDSVVETKNSILDLPNKIKEMLIGLVVPNDETINSRYAEFETLLSDRFGLIYQSADIIHDFAESFQTQAVMTADTGGIITMPQVTVSLAGTPFTFGGYEVDIIPDGFETLQQMCRLAVSMVCTVVFINMLKEKLEWILR